MSSICIVLHCCLEFKYSSFGKNYIQRCESGLNMAMQPRAWMKTYLFNVWILHFITCVYSIGEIFLDHCHLLIIDGHNHVTLEIVQATRMVGLDLVTLSLYMLHALKLLYCCFKSFE